MDSEQSKEIALNIETLNYLNALYQGRFTQLNILSQLGHPRFKLSELTKTKECLTEIAQHLENLKSGQTLLKIELGPAQTTEAQQVYLMFNALKPELTSMANEVKRILLDPYYYDKEHDVSFLCSCFGRSIYSQDNYARTYIELGQTLDQHEQIIDGYRSSTESIQESLAYIGSTIQKIKNQDAPAGFYEQLRFMARTTPGTLRSQAHDIVQLVTALSGTFGFKESGFIMLEAQSWDQEGFSALEAGYWRAFDFGVHEALHWISYEILDPGLAAEWHTAGFSAAQALEWMHVLFSPLLAIQWNNAGYDPKTAAVLVRKGYQLPETLPQDATEDIINEAYHDFYQEALMEQEALEEAA